VGDTWVKRWVGSDCGLHGRDYGGGHRPQSSGDGLVGVRLVSMVLNTIGMGLGPLRTGWAVLQSGLGPLTLFLYSDYFLN
jgi:hypothetical protein